MKLVVFFLTILTALAGLNVYVYVRAAPFLPNRARRIVLAVFIVGGVAIVTGPLLGGYESRWATSFTLVGSLIELAIILSSPLLFFVDLLRWGVRIGRAFYKRWSG